MFGAWVVHANERTGTVIMRNDEGLSDVAGVLYLRGNARGKLAVSSVVAQTAILPAGVYLLTCKSDVQVKTAPVISDFVSVAGFFIHAGQSVLVYMDGESRIGAILIVGISDLYYHQVNK